MPASPLTAFSTYTLLYFYAFMLLQLLQLFRFYGSIPFYTITVKTQNIRRVAKVMTEIVVET